MRCLLRLFIRILVLDIFYSYLELNLKDFRVNDLCGLRVFLYEYLSVFFILNFIRFLMLIINVLSKMGIFELVSLKLKA